jgi:hypothetical protein
MPVLDPPRHSVLQSITSIVIGLCQSNGYNRTSHPFLFLVNGSDLIIPALLSNPWSKGKIMVEFLNMSHSLFLPWLIIFLVSCVIWQWWYNLSANTPVLLLKIHDWWADLNLSLVRAIAFFTALRY